MHTGEIPAGVESGWHMHAGEEVGDVLARTVEMQRRDSPTLTPGAGDGFPPSPVRPSAGDAA